MADVRLSERAVLDLEEILLFSIEQFGIDRAERYKVELGRCLQRVTDDPRVGRQLVGRSRHYRRFNCQRHVIFFKVDGVGAYIVRVLHDVMDHKRHLP